jgi:hypothetical protein
LTVVVSFTFVLPAFSEASEMRVRKCTATQAELRYPSTLIVFMSDDIPRGRCWFQVSSEPVAGIEAPLAKAAGVWREFLKDAVDRETIVKMIGAPAFSFLEFSDALMAGAAESEFDTSLLDRIKISGESMRECVLAGLVENKFIQAITEGVSCGFEAESKSLLVVAQYEGQSVALILPIPA